MQSISKADLKALLISPKAYNQAAWLNAARVAAQVKPDVTKLPTDAEAEAFVSKAAAAVTPDDQVNGVEIAKTLRLSAADNTGNPSALVIIDSGVNHHGAVDFPARFASPKKELEPTPANYPGLNFHF